MRSRWLVLVGVVAASALVAFTGIGDHSGQRVLFVGDSITEQSANELAFGLHAAGWRPTVEGHTGSGIVGARVGVVWSQRLAELVRATDPDVAVIELGTNDKDASATDVARGIDAIMASVEDVPRVLWANVQRGFLTFTTAAIVNDQLLKATVRWPNLEVLDMGSHFGDHPEWLSDGLHLNQAGRAEFGTLVVAALERPPSRVGALSPVL